MNPGPAPPQLPPYDYAAGKQLGIGTATLYRKLKAYGKAAK
jgi:hypothetical protein